MKRCGYIVASTALATLAALFPLEGAPPRQSDGRVRSGVLAIYDFESVREGMVPDLAPRDEDSVLRISSSHTVRVLPGALELLPGGLLRSRSRPAKVSDMVRIGSELSLEAWIKPARTGQDGPATILAMSNGTDQRNFLLGQEGDRFVARFRTSKTDREGAPGLSTPAGVATSELTHLVFTRDRTGRARIFVNGAMSVEAEIPGGVEDWEKATLWFGNAPKANLPWVGTYYLTAIYGRDLSPDEVVRNFRAGYGPSALSQSAPEGDGRLFEEEVAPLLARRCIGCHDSTLRKGGLDLSRQEAAFAGGVSGDAISPGRPEASLVWLMTEAESMPKGLAPLSAGEKRLLRDWIDAGAEWSLERLDPAIYSKADRAMGNWAQRLTVSEYIETVRASLGVDVAKEAREILPPDLRADGFENTAYNLTVDLAHVEAYARLAATVVSRVDITAIRGDGLSTEDLIAKLGLRILRGVVTEQEIALFADLARSVTEGGGSSDDAVKYVLEAMLQSPRFLYRVELQRGDGTRWPADALEIASRLSYVIWGSAPDGELLARARSGHLAGQAELGAQVDRMLEHPRAVQRSLQFAEQWLDLGRLGNLSPSRKKFPDWDPRLGDDMRRETLAVFEDLVWKQERPLAELLNAQFSYLTPRLAVHYGLSPKAEGLARYELASVPSRGGLLTHGSVLTVGGDDASMVARGLFILRDLLFSEVGDPPPGLDTSPVPSSPGRSHRAIAMDRVESSSCGGCHSRFEPLAFGLEKFDGIGRHHEVDEHGNRLREDGEILFPGNAEPVAYDSVAEMMDLLAESDRIQQNVARKLAQFALGRPLVAADQPLMEKIHGAARRCGGTYQCVLKAIALSELIQTTPTEI